MVNTIARGKKEFDVTMNLNARVQAREKRGIQSSKENRRIRKKGEELCIQLA